MIRVVSVAGLATVQDRGRPGFMHLGVPPGGALVRGALARANRAVGNGDGAAAIELFGRMVIAAEAECVVGTDDGTRRDLAVGARVTIASAGVRVRYVAIAGGVDVPVRLGGRGTLVVAGFGGFEGRGLREGDLVRGGDAHAHAHEDEDEDEDEDERASFRLWPGTERAELGGAWTISEASDRVGVRLRGVDGQAIAVTPVHASVPMVQGAVQVPPDGQPIVLGPDHPTTGGYPVVGFLDDRDFDRFFSLRPGSHVRFRTR